MDNFELHEKAQFLADTETAYRLAKMLVQATELLDNSDRYQDNDLEYVTSPFGNEVRTWLSENLTKVIPDADFAVFTEEQTNDNN